VLPKLWQPGVFSATVTPKMQPDTASMCSLDTLQQQD